MKTSHSLIFTSSFKCGTVFGVMLFALVLLPSHTFGQILYETDGTSGNVNQISSTGVVSTLASGFVDPTLLAIDSTGTLFVVDNSLGYIDNVTPGGVVSHFLLSNRTTGVAFDSSGNLFTSDSQANITSKFTPGVGGSAFATFPSPAALAFNSTGTLFAVSSLGVFSSIHEVTPAGVVSLFTLAPFATGLAIDSSGNLFVSSSGGAISEVAPDGTVSTFASGFSSPEGLAFDSNGNLFVADSGDGTISEVTPDGTVSTFATGLTNPQGLAFSSVPEPADTSTILGLASLAACGCWNRRRSQKSCV